MQSHFKLEDRQRTLVAELKALLPVPAGVGAVAPRKTPARKARARGRVARKRGAAPA